MEDCGVMGGPCDRSRETLASWQLPPHLVEEVEEERDVTLALDRAGRESREALAVRSQIDGGDRARPAQMQGGPYARDSGLEGVRLRAVLGNHDLAAGVLKEQLTSVPGPH